MIKLTGNACEKLASELLDLTAWKGNKTIAFQEIKHALAQQIGDYANVVSEVETVSEMNAFIAIAFVVRG